MQICLKNLRFLWKNLSVCFFLCCLFLSFFLYICAVYGQFVLVMQWISEVTFFSRLESRLIERSDTDSQSLWVSLWQFLCFVSWLELANPLIRPWPSSLFGESLNSYFLYDKKGLPYQLQIAFYAKLNLFVALYFVFLKPR